jgi:ATP-binding cassette, subfamily B, multidrug efflux pump
VSELRSVLPYVRPYRAGAALGLALIVAANAFAILVPDLVRQAVDLMALPGVQRAAIVRLAALLVGAAILAGICRFGMRQLLNAISRRVETDLRDDFFAHIVRLDASFYGATRTGDLMSRATNDLQAVRQAVGPGVMYLVNTLIGTAAALFFMLRYSPGLTAVALLPMALLPVVMIHFGRVIHRKTERIQEHFGTLSSMVQENLSGMRIVRAYGREDGQAAEFDELNVEYMDRNMALARTSAIFHPLLSILTGLGLLAVLWFGGNQVMAGQLTEGQFIAFIFYLAMLTWPMIALGWVINLFQRGAASMGRINIILRTPAAIADPAEPRALPTVRGGIEFDGVWFRYPGTERWVLRDISFRVAPGETAAIVGPTAAGKSTLIALLARQFDATKGEIRIDGVPIRQLPLQQLRAAIGTVPQDAFVFSDTLGNNIGLGMGDDSVHDTDGAGGDAGERQRRIEWAADVAQLTDTIATFPDGYATRVGERGVTLSGGQRQRATLARALARQPAILIMDDALSAVDTHTEKEILGRLRDVIDRRTSIIVSHRVSAVMNANPILVLDEGRLVEQGTHDRLIARGGVYATLLRRQLLEEDLESGALAAGPSEL